MRRQRNTHTMRIYLRMMARDGVPPLVAGCRRKRRSVALRRHSAWLPPQAAGRTRRGERGTMDRPAMHICTVERSDFKTCDSVGTTDRPVLRPSSKSGLVWHVNRRLDKIWTLRARAYKRRAVMDTCVVMRCDRIPAIYLVVRSNRSLDRPPHVKTKPDLCPVDQGRGF